jgi:hypothetical protein
MKEQFYLNGINQKEMLPILCSNKNMHRKEEKPKLLIFQSHMAKLLKDLLKIGTVRSKRLKM